MSSLVVDTSTSSQRYQAQNEGDLSGPSRENLEGLRDDFPILARQVHGKLLAYLDNASTAQKPWQVIKAMEAFQTQHYANVHRGAYKLSAEATDMFEAARRYVARFLGAKESREIVFTRGATEAINLVAASWGRSHLKPGDRILLTEMEHHANIVPWQLARERIGFDIGVIPIIDDGRLDLDALDRLIDERVRLVAVTHVSNVLGTINPIADIARRAHNVGALILVDGAQAAPHLSIDVSDLDVDFYVATGHKLYGPTGIGILYGRAQWLESMPPWQGGGEMIKKVSFQETTYADIPYRFEAGTPPIAEAIGLHAALDYIDSLDRTAIEAHESSLGSEAARQLATITGVTLLGHGPDKASIVSFTLDSCHPHDVATVLDHHGIAVRAGHHCAQPLMDRLAISGSVRASFALYNQMHEVDRFVNAVCDANRLLGL